MEAIIFLGVVLKIPVLAMLYLVWWAVKEDPPSETVPSRSFSCRPPDPSLQFHCRNVRERVRA